MKKTIALVFAVSLAVFELVGCDRVEPGNVGIKVNKLGDDKGVG
ncbi:serine protease, partial [Escherichia coli]|nr:serine protease [Escherichia coli]